MITNAVLRMDLLDLVVVVDVVQDVLTAVLVIVRVCAADLVLIVVWMNVLLGVMHLVVVDPVIFYILKNKKINRIYVK